MLKKYQNQENPLAFGFSGPENSVNFLGTDNNSFRKLRIYKDKKKIKIVKIKIFGSVKFPYSSSSSSDSSSGSSSASGSSGSDSDSASSSGFFLGFIPFFLK